jgi:hypothetical protein
MNILNPHPMGLASSQGDEEVLSVVEIDYKKKSLE